MPTARRLMINQSKSECPADSPGPRAVIFNGILGALSMSQLGVFAGSTSGASLHNLARGAFTVDMWVKFITDGNYKSVIGHGLFSSSGWWIWQATGGNIAGRIWGNVTNTWSISTSNPITLGNWHHLAMTFDGTRDNLHRIYIDGKLVSTSTKHAHTGAPVDDSNGWMSIAAQDVTGNNSQCTVSWVRISRGLLWGSDFTPPIKNIPPAINVNTIEQWNMNEGIGMLICPGIDKKNVLCSYGIYAGFVSRRVNAPLAWEIL